MVPTAKTVALAKGLADAGVDQIMLADTVGYAHPAQIKEVVRATREAIGDTLYGLHLHDTCGLGIANALAGLEEGIRAFDSCLAGLGGCPYAPGASGNVVTEDLVFMLESMGFATGIDLQKLIDARGCCTRDCRRNRCTGSCRRRAFRGHSARRRRGRSGTARPEAGLVARHLAMRLVQGGPVPAGAKVVREAGQAAAVSVPATAREDQCEVAGAEGAPGGNAGRCRHADELYRRVPCRNR